MIVYKIRRKSTGLFRGTTWYGWSIKGRTFSQLAFVTSHIQGDRHYKDNPQDYEVVTCELIETDVTSMDDYLKLMQSRKEERDTKRRERYKKREAARLLKAYEAWAGATI